jgi:small basic protein
MIEVFMDMVGYVVLCVALAVVATTGVVLFQVIANVRRRMRGEPIKPFRWR